MQSETHGRTAEPSGPENAETTGGSPFAQDARGAIPTRRDIVRRGVKLAFVAPVLSTFFAADAYAANYSCYPVGHACEPPGQGAEDCCPGLSCVQIGLDGFCM